MANALIAKLNKLAHLTPDQIVQKITDPLNRVTPCREVRHIPYEQLADRLFVFVREDMSRFDTSWFRDPRPMTVRRYRDMCDGDYNSWAILSPEAARRTDLGLPPCPS